MESRDTMCRDCFKWTHRLTAGGNGLVFCDEYCAARYDMRHHTSYAFTIYKYVAIGQKFWFDHVDTVYAAWKALLDWKNRYQYSDRCISLEQAQRCFILNLEGDRAYFTRIT